MASEWLSHILHQLLLQFREFFLRWCWCALTFDLKQASWIKATMTEKESACNQIYVSSPDVKLGRLERFNILLSVNGMPFIELCVEASAQMRRQSLSRQCQCRHVVIKWGLKSDNKQFPIASYQHLQRIHKKSSAIRLCWSIRIITFNCCLWRFALVLSSTNTLIHRSHLNAAEKHRRETVSIVCACNKVLARKISPVDVVFSTIFIWMDPRS